MGTPYILVVDDEEETRTAMRAALESTGHVVRCAANGQEALNVLVANAASPALVILDLVMPVMDGYQFLGKLRERGETGVVPVLVVTAHEYDGRLADSVGYFRKPVRLDQIVDAARRWCSIRAMAQ